MQSETDFDTLWERFSVSSLATASLFALCYDSRVDDEQFGVLYTGLTTCRLRFEHRFSGADEEQVSFSQASKRKNIEISEMIQ